MNIYIIGRLQKTGDFIWSVCISGRLQKRVRSLEKDKENLHRQTTAMEMEKRDMEREVSPVYYVMS